MDVARPPRDFFGIFVEEDVTFLVSREIMANFLQQTNKTVNDNLR